MCVYVYCHYMTEHISSICMISIYMYIGHFEFCKHDETRSTKDNAITNNHHICCVCYKHVYYFRTYRVLFT